MFYSLAKAFRFFYSSPDIVLKFAFVGKERLFNLKMCFFGVSLSGPMDKWGNSIGAFGKNYARPEHINL